MTFELTHLITLITITRLATSTALAGSIWATLRGKRCQTCQMATGLSGGLPLARIGTAFYSLVLLTTFVPRSTPAAWLLATAAGAHILLVSLLLRNRVYCINCLLIAAAALIAAATTIAIAPSTNLFALFAVPAGSVLALLGIGIAAILNARRSMKLAEHLLAEVAKDLPPVPSGHVKIVVLAKAECWACEFLKKDVLPELEKEFAGIMEIEFRPALPGTPAPTLLIYGKTSLPFIGAAPAEHIAPAIRMALGQMPDPQVQTNEQITESTSAVAVAA